VWPSSTPRVAVTRAGARNHRGEASSATEVARRNQIYTGGRLSTTSWVGVLGLPVPLPPLPTPCHWGPRYGAHAASSPVAGGKFAPWAVVLVMQVASGVPPVGDAVACGGGGSSLGSGYGVSPGFGRVRQGPPHGSATGP
jgi:hypothetical protein